jgi:hypothetical protein
MERDSDGYRDYTLTLLVEADYEDGPCQVMFASGIPTIGTYWVYGNDYDYWAYCRPDMTVTPVNTAEPNKYWTVEQTFSSKPREQGQNESNDDPLLEPPVISGSFNRWTRETKVDRLDKQIKSSSHEQITGVEKDDTRPTVSFEWNTAVLDLSGMTNLINKVNDNAMWGVGARCIKLNEISWSRKVYGQSGFYFTKKFDFEVRFDTFDNSKILDTGFRCLRGKWVKPVAPSLLWTWEDGGGDKDNPFDFIRVKDSLEEPEPMRVPLDEGKRLTDPTAPKFIPKVEIYDEVNFLSYGIPSQLY